MPSQKTVSLVFGSGASRNWAHIGVMEALEEESTPRDFDHVGHTIEEGYAGLEKQIGEIRRLLEMA